MLNIARSKTLDKHESRDIGRKLSRSLRSSPLCRGITRAILRVSGKMPLVKDLLTIFNKTVDINGNISFSIKFYYK